MHLAMQFLLSALLLGFCGLLVVVWNLVIYPIFWSSIWKLPGPLPTSFFSSNLGPLLNGEKSPRINERLVKLFGTTFRFQGIAKFDQRIITFDPIAIAHIMHRTTIYQKPWPSRALISAVIGEGPLSAEGRVHRLQLRITRPAFSLKNMQSFLPIFFETSRELSQQWSNIIANSGGKSAVIDVKTWASRATLDVIGESAFGYKFNGLQEETNEVYNAYRRMFETILPSAATPGFMVVVSYPFLQYLWPNKGAKQLRECNTIIQRVANAMIKEKKQLIANGEDGDVGRRTDLLTLLLKSNMSTDIPEDQRIGDAELLKVINTIIFAGFDNTALTTTYILLLLAQHPEAQTRLREELLSVPLLPSDSDPNEQWAAISSLPYLDAVLKESSRLRPPIHSTVRRAMQEDVLPLSREVHLKDGSVTKSIKLEKGQWIHIPFEGPNIDKSAWGEDAWEFKPERWLSPLPESASKQPGAYANIMSFSVGTRACIGIEFAIRELKINIHRLVSQFVLSEHKKIIRRYVILTRPYVDEPGVESSDSMCPLVVTPYIP